MKWTVSKVVTITLLWAVLFCQLLPWSLFPEIGEPWYVSLASGLCIFSFLIYAPAAIISVALKQPPARCDSMGCEYPLGVVPIVPSHEDLGHMEGKGTKEKSMTGRG